MSNVKTKVIDFRHKAPDQAITELMQAAKDGYAVTKIVTRFHHTHVYLETSTKQVATDVAVTSAKVEETKEAPVKETAAKPVAKKTPVKTTVKKDEESKDA